MRHIPVSLGLCACSTSLLTLDKGDKNGQTITIFLLQFPSPVWQAAFSPQGVPQVVR